MLRYSHAVASIYTWRNDVKLMRENWVKEVATEADIPAEIGEELGISIAPLFEKHQQHRVERTVFRRDRVVDKIHNVLKTLWSDPDEETASSTDVSSRRLDEVISKCPVAVCRQLQWSLNTSVFIKSNW